jgi:hypothetical protein
VQADLRVLLTKRTAEARGLSRFGSNSDAHAFSRPSSASARISAAAVPPVMPHLAKPVAISSLSPNGLIRPT